MYIIIIDIHLYLYYISLKLCGIFSLWRILSLCTSRCTVFVLPSRHYFDVFIQACRPKSSVFCAYLLLNITNVFCAKTRLGHAYICPRMVTGQPVLKLYPPQKKFIFSRQKCHHFKGMRSTHPLLKNLRHIFLLLLLLWLFLSVSRTKVSTRLTLSCNFSGQIKRTSRLERRRDISVSLRLPWAAQWESAVALESDDPRCCIFSHSAKIYLASRSCLAPSRLYYLLVSGALCSPWFSPEKAYREYMH